MARSSLLRPTLVPGLPRVWRGPHTLQFGLDPTRAVLIDLPDPRAARMLDLLDGTRPERILVTHAAEHGVAASDVRELLDTLQAAGLVLGAASLFPTALAAESRARLTGEAAALALAQTAGLRRAITAPQAPTPRPRSGPVRARPSRRTPSAPGRVQLTPAQILRRRGAAQVVVTGQGRLGAGIAVALAEAGVRHVHCDQLGAVALAELAGSPLRASEVGRPRGHAVAEAVARAAPETRTHPVRRGAASLIIQLGYDQPTALLAAGYAQRRQPHLAVAIRDAVVVVGPLVPSAGRPCLNCVDLHRRDRDPGWPELSGAFERAAPEPCPVATVLAATA